VSTTTGRLCQATTKSGRPCQAPPLAGSDFCFHHDPAKAAERKAARSRGGKARHGRLINSIPDHSEAASVQTPEDVLSILEREINTVLRFEPSLNRARTVTAMCQAALRIQDQAEIEARIAALEEVLEKGNEQT